MIFGLVLLALCAAGIIASIWMTSKPKPSKQPDQNIPKKSDYRASGDFSALIDAIRDEGETYRREEGKENIGKRVRDWITITILGLTLIALAKTYYAVSDQVAEMKKTYEPIANQAKEMIADRRPFIGIAPEEIKIISLRSPLMQLDQASASMYGLGILEDLPRSMQSPLSMDFTLNRSCRLASR